MDSPFDYGLVYDGLPNQVLPAEAQHVAQKEGTPIFEAVEKQQGKRVVITHTPQNLQELWRRFEERSAAQDRLISTMQTDMTAMRTDLFYLFKLLSMTAASDIARLIVITPNYFVRDHLKTLPPGDPLFAELLAFTNFGDVKKLKASDQLYLVLLTTINKGAAVPPRIDLLMRMAEADLGGRLQALGFTAMGNLRPILLELQRLIDDRDEIGHPLKRQRTAQEFQFQLQKLEQLIQGGHLNTNLSEASLGFLQEAIKMLHNLATQNYPVQWARL